MKRTVLIDSNYLCHRAMHSTGNLRYHGIRSGVIYGFFSQLITLTQATRPDNIYFFWDSKSSERKKIFPAYKENRRVELTEVERKEKVAAYKQFNQLRKSILPEIGFNNNIIQKGYESDDTIARYVIDNGKQEDVIVATADNDLLQLLDYCQIYNLHRNEFYTADQFRTDHGIKPKQWIEVKKISGCNSDNIPGIPGIGEKTALKYLTGGLKESTKAYKNIVASPEVAKFNHKLVALPFPGTKRIEVVKNEFSLIAFLRMCRRFGMYSFRKEDKRVLIKSLFTGGTEMAKAKKGKKAKKKVEEIKEAVEELEEEIEEVEEEEEKPKKKAKKEKKGKKASKDVEDLTEEFVTEIVDLMDELTDELDDCLVKRVAAKRARKLTSTLGKMFKDFRKRSVNHFRK